MKQLLLKVVACEIAFREICFAAAHSRQLIDLEFISQGLHDRPGDGAAQLQARIDAVPAGRYDALLVGYGLCGNLIARLRATHTPLVIPRAHDCITFFLGSTERYLRLMNAHPGAYYYTSGWMECLQRRGESVPPGASLPTRAGWSGQWDVAYQHWLQKYGEAKARELVELMQHWTTNYTHGVLIHFDFTAPLHLREQVQALCSERGWAFEEVEGDLQLLDAWLNGDWHPDQFLVVAPGQEVCPSHDGQIIKAQPVAARLADRPKA